MANTLRFQSSTNIFQRQPQGENLTEKIRGSNEGVETFGHGVRQDKGAADSARQGSPEPAPRTKNARGEAFNRPRVRSQKQPKRSKKATKVTLWVKPIVKEELDRMAKREGLSLSAAGA